MKPIWSYTTILIAIFLLPRVAQCQVACGLGGALLQNSNTANLNVGVGTVTPTEKLEVNGTLKLTPLANQVAISLPTSTSITNGTLNGTVNFDVGKALFRNGNSQGAAFLGVLGSLGIGGATYSSGGSVLPQGNLAVEGKVGIGTTIPTAKLEVASTGTSNSTLVYGGVIGSKFNGGELNLVGGVPIDGAWNSQTGGQIRLGGSARSDAQVNAIQFVQNGIERMRVNNGGNVGIGTLSPANKLHIHDGVLRITGSNNYGGPMIVLGGTPNTGPAEFGQYSIEYEPTARGMNFWRPSGATNGAGTGFAPYMNYVLFLSDDNRVGINTSTPTADLTVNGRTLIGAPTITMPGNYKLYVQGGILTEKVKVALSNGANWADYVFSSEYRLKPLDEVEAFIKENNHLPGISSANDLVAEGIDLGEMQAKQMEKIEELTLYIIELNRRIAQLEDRTAPVLVLDSTTNH